MKRILDACCGSRMFWFDKQNEDALYMDNRELDDTLCDGRKLVVAPDVVADFRDMPFDDDTFYLVVFDPPHLLKAGEDSWLAKKYGKLGQDWQSDISKGFNECMRVLKPNGTLVFKWNEEQIKLSEVIEAIGKKPLFGNRRSKTHWIVYMKDEVKNTVQNIESLNKNVHKLKIHPEYFEAVSKRKKNFEIRKNDRDFKVGDILILKEFVPENNEFTSRFITREITYITDYAQNENYVVLSVA